MVAPFTALAPRSTAPVLSGWDTEVFLLRGGDRAHLHQRAAALAAFVERHPDLTLADLAATLAAEEVPDGARLTIVAELHGRSTCQTAPRLGSPRRFQVQANPRRQRHLLLLAATRRARHRSAALSRRRGPIPGHARRPVRRFPRGGRGVRLVRRVGGTSRAPGTFAATNAAPIGRCDARGTGHRRGRAPQARPIHLRRARRRCRTHGLAAKLKRAGGGGGRAQRR